MPDFRLVAPFEPTGDQPKAIEKLVNGLEQKRRNQVLQVMFDMNDISARDLHAAQAAPLGLKTPKEPPVQAAYFVEYIRRLLRAPVSDGGFGLTVELLSNSPCWKDTVIFVVEDDTQNGADHVDGHRSIFLAISPWVKKEYVSKTHTSLASIFKTVNLILGLPPLNQYDAAATDLRDLSHDVIMLSMEKDPNNRSFLEGKLGLIAVLMLIAIITVGLFIFILQKQKNAAARLEKERS